MTIIVYRDGVMAADSFMNMGYIRYRPQKKIFRSNTGLVGAASGPGEVCMRFNDWLAEGRIDDPFKGDTSDKDGFCAIIATNNGQVFHMAWDGSYYEVLDAQFLAIGCATDFALGALYAGATAIQTVKLCIEFHDGCGGIVQSECVQEALK